MRTLYGHIIFFFRFKRKLLVYVKAIVSLGMYLCEGKHEKIEIVKDAFGKGEFGKKQKARCIKPNFNTTSKRYL